MALEHRLPSCSVTFRHVLSFSMKKHDPFTMTQPSTMTLSHALAVAWDPGSGVARLFAVHDPLDPRDHLQGAKKGRLHLEMILTSIGWMSSSIQITVYICIYIYIYNNKYYIYTYITISHIKRQWKQTRRHEHDTPWSLMSLLPGGGLMTGRIHGLVQIEDAIEQIGLMRPWRAMTGHDVHGQKCQKRCGCYIYHHRSLHLWGSHHPRV